MQLDGISSGQLEVEIMIHVVVDAVEAWIGSGGHFVGAKRRNGLGG